MINTYTFLLYLFLLLSIASCNVKQSSPPPNIILFLVDDLGWQDTSVPFWTQKTAFNNRYHTPNMERLASQGMKFTQAYASAICSPTRISLMTGMNAARHRVTNWTLRKDKSTDANHPTLEPPAWNVNGLSMDSTIDKTVQARPLPEILRQHNYHTIHVGKAHLAAMETPCSNPIHCGFDVNIAGHAAGAPRSYLGTENFGNNPDGSHNSPWGVPGLEKYHGQDIFLTEALTREALSAIDNSVVAKQPFYLYMSLYAVHAPIRADKRFVQKYYDTGLDSTEAKYASMIEAMDKSLGDIMDYLEEKNIEDNTVILFMSDNGGLSAVARGGEAHTHNKPLSSGKGSAHEGGIREPMLVKWPGVVAPKSVCDDYLIIEDFFPTILNMAGIVDYQTPQKVDGISFVPFLKQEKRTTKDRPLFWHVPNNWGQRGPGLGASSTIRLGDWKLIYYHADRRFELFDIANDISEEKNRAKEKPEKVKELAKSLTTHLKQTNAQMPVDKRTGKQVEWPDVLSTGDLQSPRK